MSNGHGGARPGAGRKPKADAKVRKEFTAEELKELVMSDYVVSVTRKSVTYTEAFKVLFWTRYCDGVDVAAIFEDAGIDPKIIGRERMRDLAWTIKQQKEKESQVQVTAEEKPQIPNPPNKPKHTRFSLSENEISKMFHQVAYMSQELEFIKKIISAETEGK
jgi:hypothetical protein